MTTFRFRAGLVLALLSLSASSWAGSQELTANEEQLEDCAAFGAQGPITEYQCRGRNIERKERRLERAFGAALEFIRSREQGPQYMSDSRRSPIYLEWSQVAWRQYVEQDCTVQAGLLGGSNAWVSRYWINCYEQELEHRIQFLENVAAGTFNES